MDTQLWIVVIVQALGVSIQVGVFLQQHREYNRRISALENEKLDKTIHDIEMKRIDANLERIDENITQLMVLVRQGQFRGGRG